MISNERSAVYARREMNANAWKIDEKKVCVRDKYYDSAIVMHHHYTCIVYMC